MAKWEQLCDEDKHEEAGQFEILDASLVLLNLDWKQNQIEVSGRNWTSLRVQTEDIPKNRSRLLQQGPLVSVEKVGAGFVLKGNKVLSPRGRRGRPHEVDWAELKQHLNQLAEQGASSGNQGELHIFPDCVLREGSRKVS